MLTAIILSLFVIIKLPFSNFFKSFIKNHKKHTYQIKNESIQKIKNKIILTNYKKDQKKQSEKLIFYTLNELCYFILQHTAPKTTYIRIFAVYKIPKDNLEHYIFIISTLYEIPELFNHILKTKIEKTLHKYKKSYIIRYELITLNIPTKL